jgi:GNAT superfamily N-acetyltransferase
MNVIEEFQESLLFNQKNPLFAPLDDDILGCRIDGGFVKDIQEDGHDCQCFILDDGSHFVYDINDSTLYHVDPIPEEWFIHKYLEKIVYDLKEQYHKSLVTTDSDGNIVEPYLFAGLNEIELRGVIRLLPYRDERIVYIPSILLPPALRGKGIGLKLIADIYTICQKLDYKLRLSLMVESFYNRMVNRGATIITPLDEVEITPTTNLGHRV